MEEEEEGEEEACYAARNFENELLLMEGEEVDDLKKTKQISQQ